MLKRLRKILLQKPIKTGTFKGFTLIELMFAIAIIGILAAIATPHYLSYRYKARMFAAITDMKNIEKEIVNYLVENENLPDSLDDLGIDLPLDPWGRPYQYLRIDGGTTPGINGKRRRDKNANPVNSDFDLYSMGADGRTSAQFMAKKARDDIVRANDGAYWGLAENH